MIERLLEMLVYPLSLSLLMGLAGIALLASRHRRTGTAVVAVAIGWLGLWSLPPVADLVGRSLEGRSPKTGIEALPLADAILVFGGVIRAPRPGHPLADLNSASDRIWHAARLYHAGKAPKLILSGGRPGGRSELPSEAAAMAAFVVDLGVPREALVLEERAGNTRENAIFCADLMRARRMESALLVTSALHMPRAAAAMRVTGLQVIPVATDFQATGERVRSLGWAPASDALDRSTRALHEWVGIVVYRWRGWI